MPKKTPTSTSDETPTHDTTTKDKPLFPPPAPGKRPDYGTNNSVELLDRISNQVVEMRLDEVLEAVKTVDRLCDYERCKAKTNLIGQDCEYCRKRFCFKHGLPEVHGCGEAVKKDERQKFMHPKTGKTVREEKELSQAKKRLETKIKSMQTNRIQKAPGANKSGSGSSGGGPRKKSGK